MTDARKTGKAGSVEKIFDRLTLLVVHHDMLLAGSHGPLTPEQKAILSEMILRSKEIATLLREVLDP
jgi:hypothetical protein